MTGLRHDQPVAPIVERAARQCRALGFDKSCRPETGRLLQTLAATIDQGIIAEIGTGCGYGTAWLAAGLQPGTRLVSVEHDQALAQAASEFFQDHPRISIIEGDWTAVLEAGPFRLVYVDARPAKYEHADLVIDALLPGGIAVLDDLTPVEYWPAEWRGKPDALRDRWLLDDRFHATELRVTADHAVILAARKPASPHQQPDTPAIANT